MSTNATWQKGEQALKRVNDLIAECDDIEKALVGEAETQLNALKSLIEMQGKMRGSHGQR